MTQQPPHLSLLKRFLGALVAPPPPTARPFREMGVSGTAVFGGYVESREKSARWVGRQRYITISDMAVNTSIVAAGVHYFLNLIARPSWTYEPADESAEAAVAAELVEDCLGDLSQPWSRVVRRAGTYRFYGFGVQEWTAKRRRDGKIGLASVEPRPQASIERWSVAASGEVLGVWQRSSQTGEELGIPRRKILYLVDDVLSDSPEGVGIFRHLAEPWERLKTYYELEARALERDLRGVPVGRVPYTMIRNAVRDGDLKEEDASKMVSAMENFVKLQVKKSDTSITLDSLPYYSQAQHGAQVASVPQWGLELLQGGAAGVAEVAAAITRTQTEMARVLSCEQLMMGESSGNRSLGEDKSRNLYLIGNAVLADIVACVKRDLIPVICDLNGVPEELRPVPSAEDVSFKDADAVAAVLAQMAQAGAVLAPDDPAVEDVRSLMGVSLPPPSSPELVGLSPEPPEEDEADDGPDDDQELEEDDEEVEKRRIPAGRPALRTLYVKRRLLNAGAVRAWAAAQGIESALPASDMHVTVAFSRELVDWSGLAPMRDAMVVTGRARSVHQFPPRGMPRGALVLKFRSRELAARHREIKRHGASWDFPGYQPHVTITYSVAEADVAAIEPYRGPLIFGPEEFAEVDEGRAGDIREEPTP